MNRQSKKTSAVIGDEEDSTEGFTKRVLLSLIVDVTELRENVERLHVSVFTLAREHGLKIPD